ncbi:MAG: hypothetical protein OES12_10945, partial [Anaerolineae bacterium]|nr:hypothetical protein [Anaerolineae bacterium]
SDRWEHMYLAGLDGIGLSHDSGWQAQVTVNVIDADGNSVSGAKVVGDWKQHSGQTTCVTDDSGQCTLLSDPVTKQHTTFVVQRIQHEYLSFHTKSKLNNEGNPAERTIKVFGPAGNPNVEPAIEATPEPTDEPVKAPTAEPTPDPSGTPEPDPVDEPPADEPDGNTTAEPEPTAEPTQDPPAEPTEEATAEPTQDPAAEPSPEPTQEATPEPTPEPTSEPSDPVQ